MAAKTVDDAGGAPITDRANAFSLGTQLDYSWLLGAQQSFSVGIAF